MVGLCPKFSREILFDSAPRWWYPVVFQIQVTLKTVATVKTPKWIDVQMQWGAKCKMWPSAKIIKFVYKMAKLINGQKQWVAKWITNQLKNRCAENSGWVGSSTFRRWRSRVFFLNRTSLTSPLRFLMPIFWKLPILALADFIFQWVSYQDHVLSQMVL